MEETSIALEEVEWCNVELAATHSTLEVAVEKRVFEVAVDRDSLLEADNRRLSYHFVDSSSEIEEI